MQYVVNGGKPLAGVIEVAGAKNVALKLIIAALLLRGKTVLENVPRIRDVSALLGIINQLGGTARFVGEHTIEIENTLTSYVVPIELAARIRVSFLLMAPLLHSFGKADVPNPGGCRLGARPVDRLVESIREFGGTVDYSSEDGYYSAQGLSLRAGSYTFAKQSHTGTEFVLMLSCRVRGKSVIKNAAHEPEIDELIIFLNKAGAHILRKGNNIEIEGRENLSAVHQVIGSDRNEAVSFIVLSALFHGAIAVKNVNTKAIVTFLHHCQKAGISYNHSDHDTVLRLQMPEHIAPTDVVTSPHPGFMNDWQPLWAVLMTQALGLSTIHETVFEQRFGYVDELIKHGAHIEYFDPSVANPNLLYQFDVPAGTTPLNQAIRISGPVKLHNAVTRMTDMRAGACLLFAALKSTGTSVISGAEQIERGYEHLIERLRTLGADIQARDD